MNMHARHFVALAAVCGVALAADSYVPAPIPQDFGIHASKSAEPVVYTEFSGELINAFDRNIVERQCQMGRELGLTNKTPVFEAGYDKPNKFESQRFTSFTNEQHSATYTVTLAYGCDRTVEKAGSSADAMCDCTYRVLSSRRAEIKNRLPDGLEIIVLDPQKQVAERSMMKSRVVKSRPTESPERGEAAVRSLFPEVVGKDMVLGIPCVMRRQQMQGTYKEICVTEDPEKRLPEQMRFRTLSEYMPRPDGKGVYSSSRADKIVLNGLVDAAVFAIPDGYTVKEMK